MAGVYPFLFIPVALMAFWNGANDSSKTVATLVGGGVSSMRRSVWISATFNGLGTLAGLFLAYNILKLFTSGILVGGIVPTLDFVLAVLVGTIGWLVLATYARMPVSTTHSLTGALVVAGAVAYGVSAVLWTSLSMKVLLPLLLSPVVAFGLAWAKCWGCERLLQRRKDPARWAHMEPMVDRAHWVSALSASFTRGLNDGLKIAALGAIVLLADPPLQTPLTTLTLFGLVAVAMGSGGYLTGRRVGATMAHKVTRMDPMEGFAANLTTTAMVGAASVMGLPFSTTHVATGSLLGIRAKRSLLRRRGRESSGVDGAPAPPLKVVHQILFSWAVTLPFSGLLAVAAFYALRWTTGG